MNKIFSKIAVLLTLVLLFSACSEDDSYAEMRERENKLIQAFVKNGLQLVDEDSGTYLINMGPIKEISEEEFAAKDYTTDVEKNEYVLFKGSGIYMQIIRKGDGQKLANGKSATVLCRYLEYNISTGALQSLNRDNNTYGHKPDVMTVQNYMGTFNASFTSCSVMRDTYNMEKPPSGWLWPLSYINLGREGESALVRLIVPSTEGQTNANTNVYPCFYEISYMEGR